jgi:hypothetical protein
VGVQSPEKCRETAACQPTLPRAAAGLFRHSANKKSRKTALPFLQPRRKIGARPPGSSFSCIWIGPRYRTGIGRCIFRRDGTQGERHGIRDTDFTPSRGKCSRSTAWIAIAQAAHNAEACEHKGDTEEAREWRHIEDAMKMMRGTASKLTGFL